jgi:malate permease and related proteins
MELFTFYARIFPLFLNIILGWILGRYFQVSRESIAKILIYFATPIIVFNATYSTPISSSTLLLPALVYIFCLIVSHLFLWIGKMTLKDNRANLLAFGVGDGNTGYFGIPLVLALFGDQFINTYIFATLGIILYENTFGIYLISRGNYSIKESLLKLVKLPIIYGLIGGFIVKFAGIELGDIYSGFVLNYRGMYATLGVMLIGVALSQVQRITIDKRFIVLNLIAKFFVWPVLMLTYIYFDKNIFHLFNAEIYKILLIISIVPLPGNAVAYASLLKIHPEKAAIAVFISTIFALIYIPIFINLFF